MTLLIQCEKTRSLLRAGQYQTALLTLEEIIPVLEKPRLAEHLDLVRRQSDLLLNSTKEKYTNFSYSIYELLNVVQIEVEKQEFRQSEIIQWPERSSVYVESCSSFSTQVERGVFKPFDEGIWKGFVEEEKFILKNMLDGEKSLRKIYEGKGVNSCSLEVMVEIRDIELAVTGAGLMYNFNADTQNFYAFLITGKSRFGFFIKNERGTSLIQGGRSELIQNYSMNELGIERSENEVHLFINKNHLHSISGLTLPTGRAGIIASGTGKFYFDNFKIY